MYDEAHSAVLGEGFRAAAVEATAGRFCAIDSASVWRDLIEGKTTIVDEFSIHGWSFLVFRRRSERLVRRLAPRSLEIWKRCCSGPTPKSCPSIADSPPPRSPIA